MDYSSLDGDAQKRMMNFVKDQRKSYRKYESNETTAMTDQRCRLLTEAGFDFKPSETNKGKRGKGKKEKKTATEQPNGKSKSGESAPTPAKAKTFTFVEKADPAMKLSPTCSIKSTPMKNDEPASDSKVPAGKTPKSASARKKQSKPTYLEMAHEAILTLKDRTGSSIPAISKWILANHEHTVSAHPNLYKKRVNTCVKIGVKDGRFTKVKSSFKINPEWTKKQKAAAKAKEAARKKIEKQHQQEKAKEKAKEMKEAEKVKQQKKAEAEKKKAAEEKKRKEKELTLEEKTELALKKKRKEEAEARRKEAEARKKWVEQQLRRRRYPIEDAKLHREDKKWGVKPPEHVAKRPTLPHTLTCLVPPHLRTNTPKKYTGSVANASACGNGTLLGGDNERGLVTDAIHVYHFFCGDVGLDDGDHPVPKFSLKTLLYSLDEVMNGNAKAGKSLPPLLTHLFVTALRLLTESTNLDEDEDGSLSPVELRLQQDLSKLSEGLNPISWSQICLFYMDLMDRYYTSDVSVEEGVSPGEGKLDMSYLWNEDSMEVDVGPDPRKEDGDELPTGKYAGYLGDRQGVLAKGYSKIQNHGEPWTLKADELMALLRTLTDDILAKRSDLAEDIAGRGAKLNELWKAKRAAVVKYNKVRLAHEGPKKPKPRAKKPEGNESKPEDKNDEQADADSKEEGEKQFVPTATKKQFEAAEKAFNKAVEAYDNGLNRLISRTEPMCFDRNFNAIYFFRHDPTMLHVEQIKQSSFSPEIKSLGPEMTPFSSWHFVDTKPLYEQFLESLDDRGQREDETLKICSNLTILKRRLQGEKKENTRAVAREREMEELERRRENAKSACDAEDGRRSGRLAGMAQGELKSLDEEIKQMAKTHAEEVREEKLGREKEADYSLHTGLQMVTDLFVGQRSTRSSKKSENNDQNVSALLANTPPHKLWMDKRTGGNGTLQILVDALLALEDKCNELSPWTRQDITRQAWRKQLNDASCAWAIDCVMQLGPSADDISLEEEANEDPYTNPTKKQKVEPSSGTSLASIISSTKLCLKDLELRVFEISGKKKAIAEADKAAENQDASSDDEEDGELNKRRNCWKIKINALKRAPTGRYGLIRDIIIAAITVARKSHLNQVAAELKQALQLWRPSSAGEARSAAIKVLEKYGGYDGSDDDKEDVDFDELAAANTGDTKADDEADGAEIASLLCDEFRMISGSIGGDEFADKSDWKDAIKDCKSVSRLAVMLQSFLYKADEVLRQLNQERGNLDSILGINAKRTSRSKSGISKKHDSSTAIWCDAKLTDELVKARVNGFPWWPANVCKPLDSIVAEALKGSGYALISSVGNPGMFLVAEKDMVDFTEETEEDLSQYDKSIVAEMLESMAIAKKIWRIRNRGVTSPWSKKSRPRIAEEKKTE